MKKTNDRDLTPQNDNNVSIREPNKDYRTDSAQTNEYYSKVSNRFRVAKLVCIGALCLFVLSTLLIYGEVLTYENARYILRDIGQIISDDSSTPSENINVQADGDMDFGVYKGNIVVAGESNVKILSPSGKEKLSDNMSFTSPSIVSSDKYCIVYSLGAYNLSVYNTVARVYDMSFDFPIYSVAVSDNGYIAVMTHSREYKCTVYLYDSDFKLCATYNKNKYPSCVGISSDGSEVYISSFASSEGDYVTELSGYKRNAIEPIFVYNSYGSLVLDLKVLSSGSIALIYSDKITFSDKTGKVISENYLSFGLNTADLGDDYITVVEGDKQKNVRVYSADGKEINILNDPDVLFAYTFDENTIIQKKSTVEWAAGEEKKTFELKNSTAELIYSNGYIYICFSDGIYTRKLK